MEFGVEPKATGGPLVTDKATLDRMEGEMRDIVKVISRGSELQSVGASSRIRIFRTAREARAAYARVSGDPEFMGRKVLPMFARGVYGFVANDNNGMPNAYFILENMDPDQSMLSYFLHEVGSHLGLESILGGAEWRALREQVMRFLNAKHRPGSVEERVARRARERI